MARDRRAEDRDEYIIADQGRRIGRLEKRPVVGAVNVWAQATTTWTCGSAANLSNLAGADTSYHDTPATFGSGTGEFSVDTSTGVITVNVAGLVAVSLEVALNSQTDWGTAAHLQVKAPHGGPAFNPGVQWTPRSDYDTADPRITAETISYMSVGDTVDFNVNVVNNTGATGPDFGSFVASIGAVLILKA